MNEQETKLSEAKKRMLEWIVRQRQRDNFCAEQRRESMQMKHCGCGRRAEAWLADNTPQCAACLKYGRRQKEILKGVAQEIVYGRKM